MAIRERDPAAVVPAWGIEPVPREMRALGTLDVGMLWGNLGISLLLPVVGAFLVPALTLRDALLATVVGAAIGCAMLGAAARIGAETGVPAMVVYRAPLGIRGSYAPTAFNVAQNIGWGAVELFVIGAVAAGVSDRLLGARLRPLWIVVFGGACVAMALGGPVAVVRRWIRRYAVWAVLASGAYLTIYMLATFDLGALWSRPAAGGLGFWQGVDLAVALPVSWIPLAADYTRFARNGRAAGWGSASGYFLAQVWFYALGILLVLGRSGTDPFKPDDFIGALVSLPVRGAALGAFLLAMIALLVDETDEAFANVYSTAVSIQNLASRASQRALILGVGGVCTGLALVVDLVQYENFLLLIGALFVPLFGVLAAHYFVTHRGHYDTAALYRREGGFWYSGGLSVPMTGAWLLGFLVYNWINPGTVSWWVSGMERLFDGLLSLPFPGSARYPWLGASIASFAVAFAAASLAGAVARRSSPSRLEPS